MTIFIGMKQLVAEDLKTVTGKKLPICVPKTASYAIILEKAKEKYKAIDRKFEYKDSYMLLYEDGSAAQFMPGKLESDEGFMQKRFSKILILVLVYLTISIICYSILQMKLIIQG